MSALYPASLLLFSGTCIGLAMQAAALGVRSLNRHYHWLFLFAVLQAVTAWVAWAELASDSVAAGLRWGQLSCALSPSIAYVFGQLCFGFVPPSRRLGDFQRLNLFLTTLFSGLALCDALAGSSFVLAAWLEPETATQSSVRANAGGKAYLAFAALSLALPVRALFAAYQPSPRGALGRVDSRPELRPLVWGAASYALCLALDLVSWIGFGPGGDLRQLGCVALLIGGFRFLVSGFERGKARLEGTVQALEDQRRKLLLSPNMVQKQRLDGLGALVTTVAHEINNPIQGILNYVTLLRSNLEDKPLARDYLDKIDGEGERVAYIARALLRFGRSDDAQSTLADLGEIVRSTLTLAQSAVLADGIALRVSVASELPPVHCRPYQLQQILVNLINNAREALAARCPTRTDEKAIQIVVDKELRDGAPWVTFAVCDNGSGIDPVVAAQIFDPFFTTKHDSGGSGLGLAISHGIAEAHGGNLRLAHTHLRGTTFLVELPCDRAHRLLAQASA